MKKINYITTDVLLKSLLNHLSSCTLIKRVIGSKNQDIYKFEVEFRLSMYDKTHSLSMTFREIKDEFILNKHNLNALEKFSDQVCMSYVLRKLILSDEMQQYIPHNI